MGLRDLRNRIRDTRSGDTTHPLGLDALEPLEESPPAEVVPWLTPAADEDTDPGGADLASIDPLPAGAVRNRQNVYVGGNRCAVCHVPSTDRICVKCTIAGRLPAGVDGYVAPGLERILPDPPRHLPPRSTFATCADPDDLNSGWMIRGRSVNRLDGAGYVLEPLPDVADFEEARDRLRAEVLDRIHSDGAA